MRCAQSVFAAVDRADQKYDVDPAVARRRPGGGRCDQRAAFGGPRQPGAGPPSVTGRICHRRPRTLCASMQSVWMQNRARYQARAARDGQVLICSYAASTAGLSENTKRVDTKACAAICPYAHMRPARAAHAFPIVRGAGCDRRARPSTIAWVSSAGPTVHD